MTFKFEDQYGDLGTTQHRINIDNIGYRQNGDIEYLPLSSTIQYRAYYSSVNPGYHINGPYVPYTADSTMDVKIVYFQTITFDVRDQGSSLITTAWTRITNIGDVASGGTDTIPLGATINHKAYIDASTYSTSHSTPVTTSISTLTYVYDTSIPGWISYTES